MGLLSEIQLRSFAYFYCAGDLIGNVFRNGHARLFPDKDSIPTQDLTGKTCIITGGNAGIGFATAKLLCQRGCHVILACRSVGKATAAAEEIKAACGSTAPAVDVAQVSLSSLQSVRDFCKDYNRKGAPLDILVLNAGIMGTDFERKMTADGFEEHFQVNHLSQWLMAHQLVGAQLQRRQKQGREESAPVRVVFVSSCTYVAGKLDLGDLQIQRRPYSGFRAYTASKLANILSARQLQAYFDRKLQDSGDAAVAVHPGLIQTSLAHGWLTGADIASSLLQPITAAILTAVSAAILEPPERAAKTVAYACTAPATEVGGQYVAYGKPRWSLPKSRDMALAGRLWERSLQLCQEPENAIEASSG